MVKSLAVGLLLVTVGVVVHRSHQVMSSPAPLEVEEALYGYGERWVQYDEDTMVFVGMKYNEQTGEWVIVNYFTPPVSIDNRLGGAGW